MIHITAIFKHLWFTIMEIWTYKGDFERRSLKDDYMQLTSYKNFINKLFVI